MWGYLFIQTEERLKKDSHLGGYLSFSKYTRDKDNVARSSPLAYTKPMCLLVEDFSLRCSFKRVLRER